MPSAYIFFFFFFNDTATTEIYTLSLHDALPISICPGFFPSKMASGLLEKIGASVIAQTPLGRIGNDTDLQGAAVYLASDASRHVTGQYIAVDGGASIV